MCPLLKPCPNTISIATVCPTGGKLANGLDPFTPGETFLDPDKDGLTTIDEYEFNTNPNSDDTDGDGQKDFAEVNRSLDLDPDYLAIRLQTRDTGKVNNGMNCAVCHTTQLKVGDFSHYTKSSERTTQAPFSEKTFYFRKGTNYPIQLTELAQNLSQAPPNGNNPTTTAAYNANILAATNQPRAFVVQDPQNKLGTNKPWSSFPTDPSVSVGTLIVPKIEVTFTNVSGNLALDANTNAGGGVRVFPDGLNPTDLVGRNRVRVRVKTIPALPQEVVRLKWYDVDDPSPNDAQFILDAEDRTGEKGTDNRGSAIAVALSQTTLLLDNQGEAITDFTTTMKPGDNFRVAAVLDNPGAQAHLDQLQLTNASAPLYLTADTNTVRGFAGGISPMITVWRKLHLEFDSMLQPPASGPEANHINGTITAVRTNYPTAGRSHVTMNYTGGSFEGGLFAAGKLDVSGVGTFRVAKSWTWPSQGGRTATLMELDVAPGGLAKGQSASLYDDDDRYLANDPLLYPSLVNLPSPPLSANGRSGEFISAMQFRFTPAYIKLVDAHTNGWNPNTNIAFRLNAAASDLIGNSVFDAGNLDLKGKDKPEFWCFSVCFGYQPGTREDGDGHEEVPLLGGTPETSPYLVGDRNRPFGYSVVFLESIRDDRFGVGRSKVDPDPIEFTISASFYRGRYTNWLYGIIAHELGHAPGRQSEGADHNEEELMVKGGGFIDLDFFRPRTIRRFRSAPSWTQ